MASVVFPVGGEVIIVAGDIAGAAGEGDVQAA